jgi:hypothetical protein
MRAFGFLMVALVAGLLSSGACSSDHDALKKKPPGTGGGGGATDAGEAGPDVEVDVTDDGPPEPVGKTRLTLLHGVVDDPKIAFCFAKVSDGVVGDAIGSPLPPAGLSYGRALPVGALEGIDLAKDDFLPILLAGDFSLFAGKSCTEAIALAATFESIEPDAGVDGDVDAGDDAQTDADSEAAPPPPPPPPPVRARELAVLPAGTLAEGYSYLLIATGCIGGPAFTDANETLACGENYKPTSPTLSPVFVQLSRLTAEDRLGLQIVNAAQASGSLYLSSKPPAASTIPEIPLANGLGFGAIAPIPPSHAYPKSAFGSPIAQSSLSVREDGSPVESLSMSWSNALATESLTDVEDGKNYAAILIGPKPTLPKSSWWNEARVGIVASDPETQ